MAGANSRSCALERAGSAEVPEPATQRIEIPVSVRAPSGCLEFSAPAAGALAACLLQIVASAFARWGRRTCHLSCPPPRWSWRWLRRRLRACLPSGSREAGVGCLFRGRPSALRQLRCSGPDRPLRASPGPGQPFASWLASARNCSEAGSGRNIADASDCSSKFQMKGPGCDPGLEPGFFYTLGPLFFFSCWCLCSCLFRELFAAFKVVLATSRFSCSCSCLCSILSQRGETTGRPTSLSSSRVRRRKRTRRKNTSGGVCSSPTLQSLNCLAK